MELIFSCLFPFHFFLKFFLWMFIVIQYKLNFVRKHICIYFAQNGQILHLWIARNLWFRLLPCIFCANAYGHLLQQNLQVDMLYWEVPSVSLKIFTSFISRRPPDHSSSSPAQMFVYFFLFCRFSNTIKFEWLPLLKKEQWTTPYQVSCILLYKHCHASYSKKQIKQCLWFVFFLTLYSTPYQIPAHTSVLNLPGTCIACSLCSLFWVDHHWPSQSSCPGQRGEPRTHEEVTSCVLPCLKCMDHMCSYEDLMVVLDCSTR